MDDIRVEMRTTEELDADTRATIIAVCVAAHETDAFLDFFSFISAGGRHFVGYRGTELVTHAVVTTRGAQPEGHPVLRTAYVDGVSTLPVYQGQGYGRATMQRLAAEIDDYEIACLETDKPGFYERLGWQLWRGPLAGRSDSGLIPTPEQQGVMVLALPRTPPLDLDAQLTIECQPSRIWE